jgi:O-methyltransferase involved in polyketide biosynthesis
MSETASHTLSGVPETSLAALYWRAMESQRPDALIKDEKAEALVAQLDYDFDRIRQIPMPELLYVMRTMLTREMDRYARGVPRRSPGRGSGSHRVRPRHALRTSG